MLVDSFSQKVRLEALRHFAGTEIAPRLVYNSIAEDYTDEELDCLRECGIKKHDHHGVQHSRAEAEAADQAADRETAARGQPARGSRTSSSTPVCWTSPASGGRRSAIREIKETLGYPCGCAPSNALFTWEKLRSQGQPAFEAAAAATFTLTQTQGADFVHYGPIRNAPWVYQAVATTDAMTAYAGRITGVRPASDAHPLYRIF